MRSSNASGSGGRSGPLRSGGYRHVYLLAALILLVGARPFLGERVLGLALIEGLLFVTVIAAGFAASSNRARMRALAWGGAVAACLQVAALTTQQQVLVYSYLVGYAVFYCLVAVLLTKSLFRDQETVNTDTLCGAVSVYMILGLIWTFAYVLLEYTVPGSFHFNTNIEALPVGKDVRFERLLGFSFTTLTTLGYGNVAPATARADSLATLEAIAGQAFVAIVIARLVALQIVDAQSRQRRDDEPPH